MTVINRIMVEMVQMVNVVARDLGGTQTTTTSTPTAIPSTTSSTDPAASSSAAAGNTSGNTTTQSPLLFFVALGFGVVFTNLWYAFNRDYLSTLL